MSRSPEHRARMIARRECQLARTPGFEPAPSKRIVAALLSAAGELEKLGHTDPVQIFQLAWAQVARSLPAQVGRVLRAPRPSKSDSAAYRKALPA